ncbi:unnamed protein product [Ilex paraguariensis]|uniref:Uncharacterized protein n=1 Tax=Ilex paraguariensis TaxID=185542 RepID=A0ABC8UQQ6_9AQUA
MFNNAGTLSTSDQTVLDLDVSQFDWLFAAARAMVEPRVKGSIVCTASGAARNGANKRTVYIMSKHAVLGLVRWPIHQLGGYGTRVNSVSPSGVPTRLICKSQEEIMGVRKRYEPLTSLKGTVLSVRHVADAVLFLVSDESAFITGHELAVDGGFISLPDPVSLEAN